MPDQDGQEKASTSSTRSSCRRDVISMERNRREKMTEFYTLLQSMVPNLFPKATRTRIIDETIAHIKSLEQVIAALDAQKAARLEASSGGGQPSTTTLHTQRSSTFAVEVTMSGNSTAFFGIRFASRPGAGMVTKVLEIFEKHNAEVLNATVACSEAGNVTVTVTASVLEEEEDAALDKIKGDLMIL